MKIARFPDSLFVDTMKTLFPTTKFLQPSRPRATGAKVDCVFCDAISILNMCDDYWTEWNMPHIFDCALDFTWEPPSGWILVTETFVHAQLGGSTDGRYALGIMLPVSLAASDIPALHTLPPQPWMPFSSMLDSRITASLAKEPPMTTHPLAQVYRLGSKVLPWGLFPSNQPRSVVRVRSVFNASKWGSRRLSYEELGGL